MHYWFYNNKQHFIQWPAIHWISWEKEGKISIFYWRACGIVRNNKFLYCEWTINIYDTSVCIVAECSTIDFFSLWSISLYTKSTGA